MSLALLPTNSKLSERAAAEAIEFPSEIGSAVTDLHGVKYQRPLNETVAPWIALEYGLGPISRFFDFYEDLIDEGRIWQRLRGTPRAISMALAWIGYSGITIEDQKTRRRRWHLYQIEMGRLPIAGPSDDHYSHGRPRLIVDENGKYAVDGHGRPLIAYMPAPVKDVLRNAQESDFLNDAEYLAGVSDPARSEFFRGFHGYDIRGVEWSNKRWGSSLFGDSSGVRISGGAVKWSHGRTFHVDGDAGITDWSDLGVGLVTGDPASWSPDLPWNAAGLTWDGVASAGDLRAWILLRRTSYMMFMRADNSVIGYSLIVMAPVDITPIGSDYDDEFSIQYTVRTGFGDGAGETAAFVAIAFNGRAAAGVKPFKRWLTPEEIEFPDGPVIAGKTTFADQFKMTVRDRVVLKLSF